MDPVARAKKAFFACLGSGVAILLFVDLHLGPAAFAVPPATDAAPSAVTTTTAPSEAPSEAPSAAPSAPASAAPVEAPPEPPASAPSPANEADAQANDDLDPSGHYTGVVATFEFEQSNADLEKLKVLAKQMHADTTSEIVLEGHSDPSGNEYRNLTLSLDRANWCADRLVEYGINRMRIRTVGLGSARTIVDTSGDAGSVNRRVEVRWVMKQADGGGR